MSIAESKPKWERKLKDKYEKVFEDKMSWDKKKKLRIPKWGWILIGIVVLIIVIITAINWVKNKIKIKKPLSLGLSNPFSGLTNPLSGMNPMQSLGKMTNVGNTFQSVLAPKNFTGSQQIGKNLISPKKYKPPTVKRIFSKPKKLKIKKIKW